MSKTKQITCVGCCREFSVTQRARTQYAGVCPHCGTYDNGTSRARLTTNAERALCAADGHDMEWNGNRGTCVRCGHWEEITETDSPSIFYHWQLVKEGGCCE